VDLQEKEKARVAAIKEAEALKKKLALWKGLNAFV
jgi:hypothetical protein